MLSPEEEVIKLKSKFSPAKQALLEKRLRGEVKSKTEELPTIVPNPDDRYQPFPLTDVQQAYWIGRSGIFELSNVSSHGYLEIETADLDLERFEKAWQRLIDHHEMLRMIINSDGQQQILEQVPPYKIKVVDLRGKSSELVASQLAEIRNQMSHQVLPADTWPLFDIRVAKLDKSKARLYISLEVLIGDGWSFEILLGELADLIQNPDIYLAPYELSFRDYVLAEIDLRNSQLYLKAQEYWQSRLASLPSSPELPLDKSPATVKYPRFLRRSGKLAPDTWHCLKRRATEANLTASGILLAAFAEILTVWSKSPRFTINLTLFNRLPLHPEVNQIVGDFTSLNLLAVDNSQQESFAQRSQRIQKQLWQDFDYRYFSGVKVLRELARRQKRQSEALMPVVFTSRLTQENLSREKLTKPQIGNAPNEQSLSSIDRLGKLVYALSQTPQVYLDLQVSEREGTLVLDWDAVEEVFPPGLLDDMFAAYCDFLNRLAHEEDLWQTTTRQLLPSAQLKQIAAINATETPIAEGALLQTLFFEQVALHPKLAAVVTSSRTLTYQELCDRANHLAHQLRQQGIRPNQLVAIVMEKGWEQVVAALAILASGAAYVPIDPGLPSERRQHLLEEAQVQCILTQSWLDTSLEWSENITRLCIDTVEPPSSSTPLESIQQPSDLAYVIYTSGSTGKPKGVMIDHRGAVNTILDINQRFNVQPQDRVFALSSLSFDLSVYDIFGTLAAGGTIVIPDADATKDPAHWAQLIVQHQVTIWNSVPALMQMLVEYAANRSELLPQSLRLVMLSGDWLPLSLPDQIRTLFQDVQVISLGGATEASIWSILYPIEKVDPTWKSIPYGRPMRHQHFYVLNEALEPCPVWVTGQLYIGGIGLAKGYWRNPEKTNASFIIHPRTQERLYKTGDLGRYLPDGNIEFIGRIDHQVKIRGFRIELGEIEAVLNTHPQIQQAVVIATEDIASNQRLVAYIVTRDESLTNNQLREFLFSKLPEYMVPNVFVTLDTLPLTPNGKVDRKALPAPDGEINREHQCVAPRTPSEEIIANIFASVLGVQNVGIHDNFFELGGHSLLATQLISRLRVAWDVEIPLRTVFESPTVAQLEQTLTQLRTTNSGLSLPPIQPRTEGEQIPLSFAQQRLWFLNQLEGSSATYNLSGALRITGNLNVHALQQALSEILRRHEVLRTSFQTVNGTPIQVIHPEATLNITLVDLERLEVPERETVLHQQLQLEAITEFNLEIAPLIRCSLLQLSATESVLLLTMHHIVADGWSIGVFIQELSSLYQAFCTGEPSPLAKLPIQYADFAVWQRQWLCGEVLETQLNYWQQQLQGAPDLLQLPTDRPRPSVQTYRGTTQSFTLDTDLTQKLQTLSQESGTTLFMTLLAAFATLLYRYSGQEDILIGSPIANRHRREIESLIGFFVNTLVLRTRFEDNPSMKDLLAQVRDTTLKAYEHQDVPFEQVVEVLQPQRSLSHSPLFQVMFVLQNAPMGEVELPGVTLTQLERESTIAKFDLTVLITETSQGLVGEWEYNSDLFDGSTIERMAAHFQNLLSAIVENPQQTVAELPLLSEAQQHKLLREWNQTQADYPKDVCIHQLFEEQVERTPDAVAVVFENQQLTYRELNARANQLAHYLQELGVKPEVLVGICVERSLDMVIGLLGILKAGGAYVPLDPTYPPERLAFMLEDAQVPVLLTQFQLLETLPTHQAKVFCLDTDGEMLANRSQENPDSGATTDNLAYVIYTSGSTGTPKGAMNTHQGICNRLVWMQETYQLTIGDRILQKTPFSFDVSVWEFFWPLMTGARLVVAKPGGHQDSAYLVKLIATEQITTLHFVPSMLQVFLEEPRLETCNGLKRVICSGEALPFELTQRFFARLDAELHNLYGPTEAAIDVTFWQCQRQSERQTVPIGRPIANTQIYILDSHLTPTPIGVPGELYIGGDGLARGYLNRPELTAEKFIPNPFGKAEGRRLYKTGDLARYLPNGEIEFLGRIDHQVKVRGFRIELGEIEAALNQHPAVRETVVLAQEKVQGDKRLIAYIVTEQQLAPSINDLRRFLKEKLPEYMVPSVFVQLEALPLTPNGKIDRKVLPAPDTVRPELDKAFVAPRTPVETTLVEIWSQVLGVEQVGIYDNFFELGGDSILTIQIVARANQAGLQLTPKQLFEYQNIADLAAVAVTKKVLLAEQGLVTGVVFLTPIQKWFFEKNLSDPHHFNQAVLLEVRQAIDLALLEQALQHLLLHHDVLRLRFEPIESGWQQVQSSPDVSVPLTRWDFSALAEAEQTLAIEATATELQASLNLSTGLLVRVGFFDLGVHQPSRLLIVIHHLVVDGVSWRILLEDLQTAYQQLSQGEQVQLPAKTTSFQQWSQKLGEYVRSTALQQELDYWRRQSRKPSIPLPVDFPGGENTMASVGCVSSTLSFSETQALLKEVPQIYNTQINDVLLTALVQAFAQWTGERTLLVNIEGHGREDIADDVDLSRTVGWFTTIFPVLLNLGEASNPGDALKKVKEQLRGIPNRGIGYGVLRYLSDDPEITEQLRTLPQAEVIFNYLGQFDQTLSESSLFGLTQESSGLARSLRGKRSHLLEIDGLVSQGQLQLKWSYNHKVHRRSTIETLAQGFVEALRSLIAHCQSPEAGGFTPSDFPLAQLGQDDLDAVLGMVEFEGGGAR
ncbi:non-ribosomal peptide synthetase [Allocoleopsis franciscana]|uniref:Non-ribosomal peptide synthase/amino acid adenylation enzyme n=1 Tax=Allocoleopsis franciscana PCC 7113 TaxID=1173027 RepID=K9WBL7_9CYAN|nr:non-ribosomal peptide synthetase [Allocoleopsis franciscana]AFZ17608.1 non-ribosomal peptide synthase/amino acid adenylation enzyme [Allocoleopsis franciscana PCC 7113]